MLYATLHLNYISTHLEQQNTVCVLSYQALRRRSWFTEVHGPVAFRVRRGCQRAETWKRRMSFNANINKEPISGDRHYLRYNKYPIPFLQIGSKKSLNPGGIPLTVSQEYPPSGSRKGRRRSRLSSSWMSRPSLRIRLSAEASAAATTTSIKSCSKEDKWIRQRKHFRKRLFQYIDWLCFFSFCEKASWKGHPICLKDRTTSGICTLMLLYTSLQEENTVHLFLLSCTKPTVISCNM